jgi:hypothetical protein
MLLVAVGAVVGLAVALPATNLLGSMFSASAIATR